MHSLVSRGPADCAKRCPRPGGLREALTIMNLGTHRVSRSRSKWVPRHTLLILFYSFFMWLVWLVWLVAWIKNNIGNSKRLEATRAAGYTSIYLVVHNAMYFPSIRVPCVPILAGPMKLGQNHLCNVRVFAPLISHESKLVVHQKQLILKSSTIILDGLIHFCFLLMKCW